MPDTLDKIAHQVLSHGSLPGKPLATIWAQNAFAELADLYDRWSWRTAYGEFIIPDAYSTGTVAITLTDPTLVVGTGTAWTQGHVGMQFMVASATYDVLQVIDGQHLRLNLPWGDNAVSGVGYMLRQQYVLSPPDFQSFVTVVDPTRNYKLRHGIEKREIDRRDARRTTTGSAYIVAEAGMGRVQAGSVDLTPIQAKGTGAAPAFGGDFTGPVDAVFTVEVTLGGASGVATFQWKRDNILPYVTGVVSDEAGVGLSDNVVVYWPSLNSVGGPVTYTLGDIFIARARALSVISRPRYEIWPTQLTRTVFPFYYQTTVPDLTGQLSTLPYGIRGDVILKGAMSECRAWGGRGTEKNLLYDLKGAAQDYAKFREMAEILILRDDDFYPKEVNYFHELPFAGPPWDSAWEQRHA